MIFDRMTLEFCENEDKNQPRGGMMTMVKWRKEVSERSFH